MITTIIKLKDEINEQHYHDRNKPVYVCVDATRYNIERVDEFDDEVLIQAVKADLTEDEVRMMENGETD